MKYLPTPTFTIILALVLIITTTIPSLAAASESNEGSVQLSSVGAKYNGIDYVVDGVDISENANWSPSVGKVSGTITAPVVTLSGTLKLVAGTLMHGAYTAKIVASTSRLDANGNSQLLPAYNCDGPTWAWDGELDNLDSYELTTNEVPFSLAIPVPGYDPENDVTHLYFCIELECKWYDNYGGGHKGQSGCWVTGQLKIPEDMKPKPSIALSMTNGGKLDPLRISFRLMDNSTKPPKPLANKVIKVIAPIPGKPSDAKMNSAGKPKWKLSGYFMSKTKCPNCDWKQATSQYTSEIYYYLKDPGQPIEVLTDKNGTAELLFFLNSPSLQGDVPTRERSLGVSIQAEYIATEGEFMGDSLAKGNFKTTLNHIGYIVDVSYVQPQEWDAPVGKLGDYTLAGHNPAEYPLDSYVFDKGSGVPGDDIRGSDRATIAVYLSDQGGSDGYGVAGGTPSLGASGNEPTEIIKAGMLFAPGDRINLDARGMVRYKPVDPQSPESQFKGKPGWIWVQVKFFDGLKAKVGVNGICGKHSMTFGNTAYQSGWKTSGWTFMWWGAKEGAEAVFSKFVPVYGQIDLARDVAGYIKWFTGDIPIYVRLRSEVAVTHNEDSSTQLVVREGQPDVVTEQTGLAGIKVTAGKSAEISANSQVRVVATKREQAAHADKLLAGLGSANDDSAKLTPIEPGGLSAPESTPNDWEDAAGDVPIYEDEAGDVPLTGTGIDGIESIYPPATDTWETRYHFDEFSMGFWNGWNYFPDSEEEFASLFHDEIPLYIVIAREEASTERMLELMELEVGYTDTMVLGGKGAVIHALLENGEEFGFLLSFDEPLRSGKNLHLMFFSDAEYMDEVSEMMVEILLGMRFD